MGEVFPKEIIGRIISAFVMLKFFTVFIVQSGMGYILALWPHSTDGYAPPIALKVAFIAPYVLQIMSFAWFSRGWGVSLRNLRTTDAVGMQ